jgi:hypothetical protein
METIEYTPNFLTGTKSFRKGYYTFESGIGFRFMYRDTFTNANRINNSSYVLELFNELPENATLNK